MITVCKGCEKESPSVNENGLCFFCQCLEELFVDECLNELEKNPTPPKSKKKPYKPKDAKEPYKPKLTVYGDVRNMTFASSTGSRRDHHGHGKGHHKTQ